MSPKIIYLKEAKAKRKVNESRCIDLKVILSKANIWWKPSLAKD
jgi:hypothetical protein